MIVTLNQVEIENAIVNYVNSHAVATTGKKIEIGLTAGRKGNGFSATVSIDSEDPSIRELAQEHGIDMPETFVSEDDIESKETCVEKETSAEETDATNIFGAA